MTPLPIRNDVISRPNKLRSLASMLASFEATPVTAKHNLERCHDEEYLRTTVQFADGREADILMTDGGCVLELENNEEEIEVRAATENSDALTWGCQDLSFGIKLDRACSQKSPGFLRRFLRALFFRLAIQSGLLCTVPLT
eukprot:scaffold18449_cov49-Attheya_sp.AAC.5